MLGSNTPTSFITSCVLSPEEAELSETAVVSVALGASACRGERVRMTVTVHFQVSQEIPFHSCKLHNKD